MSRQIAVIWNWNGMESYKGCYIQYSTDDWLYDVNSIEYCCHWQWL